MNFIEELTWRGAVKQVTDEKGLVQAMQDGQIGAYVGTDPTADSLHLGHLIPFMVLKRFQQFGGKAVIVIGGTTGAIGDPRPTTERKLLSQVTLDQNTKALTKQVLNLFGDKDTVVTNNNEWLSEMTLPVFLRDYGKLFSINVMLKKDVVATRLETGISFTEFTYQILQAIDFLQLYQRENVQLQIGGSDQWGNITSGVDLIHTVKGSEVPAFGLTIPLMTDANGNKFGKSEGNAIWLDKEKTSPYTFYQFWFNQSDSEVIKYLKYFTFLAQDEINELEVQTNQQPEKRMAQKRLAQEMTSFVHGQQAVREAEELSQKIFNGEISQLTGQEIKDVFVGQVPSFELPNEEKNIIDLLVDAQIDSSKRQAREDVENGAIRVNGEKVTSVDFIIDGNQFIDGQFLLIGRGKKRTFLGTTN